MMTPASDMLSGPRRRSTLGPAAAAALVAAGGCGDPAAIRTGDVRTYETARISAEPRPSADRPPGRLAVRYETPAGWTDRGGSGMRLATLTVGDPADGHEVTVIPAAGSLEANVARWLGQLDQAADPAELAGRAAAALAAAETVETEAARATIVSLGGGTDAVDGEAILAAAIPVDDVTSLFVKLKGPAVVARREREAFVNFVKSLRWK